MVPGMVSGITENTVNAWFQQVYKHWECSSHSCKTLLGGLLQIHFVAITFLLQYFLVANVVVAIISCRIIFENGVAHLLTQLLIPLLAPL